MERRRNNEIATCKDLKPFASPQVQQESLMVTWLTEANWE